MARKTVAIVKIDLKIEVRRTITEQTKFEETIVEPKKYQY